MKGKTLYAIFCKYRKRKKPRHPNPQDSLCVADSADTAGRPDLGRWLDPLCRPSFGTGGL